MNSAITLIIGIVIGAAVTMLSLRKHTSGSLRVDHSISEDDPYMFLELTDSVSTVLEKKYVVLNVKVEDFIPHK